MLSLSLPAYVQNLLPAKLRSDAPIVAVVRLEGVIGGGRGGIGSGQPLSLASVAAPLRAAFNFKPAKAVAIIINSPGGSPVQSHLIYKRIRQLALEKQKPVFAYVEDVAASGGYMIACAADEIIADDSSIVGSIGVVSAGFGFVEALEKLGVERRVYTSGASKSQLDPFRPEKPEDIERLKALQQEIHDMFIGLVKERRGDVLSEDEALFSGQFWAGRSGQSHGLVDRIGDMRGHLRERFGDKVKFKLFSAERGLLGRRKSSVGFAGLGEELPRGLIAALEERSIWARFGL